MIIAEIFGVICDDKEKLIMIKELMVAKTKLLGGENIKLDIAIGIMNTNKERPFESCSGVSLNTDIIVKNNSKSKEDSRLVRWLMRLIIKLPTTPITPIKTSN